MIQLDCTESCCLPIILTDQILTTPIVINIKKARTSTMNKLLVFTQCYFPCWCISYISALFLMHTDYKENQLWSSSTVFTVVWCRLSCVYVHSPTGAMPSLVFSGGSRFSSHRNFRGKWTSSPRTAFSSSLACSGLVSQRRSWAVYSFSSRVLCTVSWGRHLKTWM